MKRHKFIINSSQLSASIRLSYSLSVWVRRAHVCVHALRVDMEQSCCIYPLFPRLTLQICRFPFRNATLASGEGAWKREEFAVWWTFSKTEVTKKRDGPSAGRDGRRPPLVTASGGRAGDAGVGELQSSHVIFNATLRVKMHLFMYDGPRPQDNIWPGLVWKKKKLYSNVCESIVFWLIRVNNTSYPGGNTKQKQDKEFTREQLEHIKV